MQTVAMQPDANDATPVGGDASDATPVGGDASDANRQRVNWKYGESLSFFFGIFHVEIGVLLF